ncbi:MAG: DUF4251 domain-containing protein [Sphingobacteriales bacterium]|jgi:hypothetical protein|nr:DUF4251 domain-containing protein [Sphingobacteriales bacterium]OJW03318.1 MAG: hypothetical protein BGO52_23420 [Sphingobacteriales bacterium 44-61]
MITAISLRRLLLPVLLISSFTNLEAQSDTAVVRQQVEARKYTFIAQNAMPMRGRTVQLTSLYDLKITGDSVISALPYYGRAYSAPVNPSENGLNFTSVSFDYQVKYRKKRWEVSIKPKDVQRVSEMNLIIYSNGRASLQVTSNDRQPISFNGVLSSK